MGKKENITSDEQLFDMQREARKRKKRKYIIILVSILVVVLVGVIVGVTTLRKRVNEQVGASSGNEVQSAEVSTGSISTTVSGEGTLSDENTEELEVLNTVEIVDYYVEAGDKVEEGDLIATVTSSPVLAAMADKQEELDAIDEEIQDASGDEANTYITSSVAGRVKKIFVSSGDDVVSEMYDHGALILLSLDGYMAVDVETDSLAEGETVSVKLSSGSSVSGTVEKVAGGVATVTVTDNGTKYNDSVTVYDSDKNAIGEGNLYIHSQMAVTGYAGTVSSVYVSNNQKISSGKTLIKLTDTETSANYDALLKERQELEDALNALVKIYKEGGVCASTAGAIVSVGTTDTTDTTASANAAMNTVSTDTTAQATTSGYTTVATLAPSETMAITISIDENDILSLEEGQTASVTIDSVGEDTFTGIVTDISTEASSESGVTSYSATVSIEKTEQMLSGMSASVVVTIEGVDNALLIPVDALHQTSSTAYVYTEYDEESGEFSGMVEVTTGLANSSYVEIKEGLSAGDTVYYTESEDEAGFGDMFNMQGGEMPGGMEMPSGGQMPGGGGTSGDGGGQMPGGGGMPSGN